MGEHVRIFGAVVNLIIGSGIAVYAYQLFRAHALKFLKPLIHYVILYNLLILSLLTIKYFELNLSDKILPPNIASYAYIFGSISVSLGYIMIYKLYQISLAFREKKLSSTAKFLIYSGIIILTLGFQIKYFLPSNVRSSEWIMIAQGCIGLNFCVLEIVILIGLLIYGLKKTDRKERRLIKSFGFLFLSRYGLFIIMISIALPVALKSETIQGIIAFSILFLLNIIPFLWLRYFFLKYTTGMLKFIEDESILDQVYQQYKISKREQEILKLILEGNSNRKIEEALFISYHTVKNHVYNLYQKLGVKNRYELIHFFNKIADNH